MSGLDTSQVITDEFVLHEGHVHAEQKKAEEEEAHRKAAEAAKKD
ncbi:MAG: hypothetical protein JWO12_3025 [Frankiales bacterium]|nr:hypothetical protein [Frankiales bacterium]